MMQFCFGRERERGCQWTLHTEGGGEGGEGRGEMRKKEKEKRRIYPVSEYGRWQHCGKEEGGEYGSLHFDFFSFPFLGKTSVLAFSSDGDE